MPPHGPVASHVLEVREAARRFPARRRSREVQALDGVSLGVRPGEVLVIVGPSGSGKTTLLRVLAGLESLDSGRVLIDDVDVTDTPAGQRNLAFVFADLGLLPHLDVAGNIGFGERARGSSRAEVSARVIDVADALGLTQSLGRRIDTLSGGERQKVALARAVIRRPKAFLLDEPLAHLDPVLRSSARRDLLEVGRIAAAPLVYVTHDAHEALGIGDRIAVMRAGRLVQVGTPDEVYAAPVDTFVATFLGPLPMNLVARDGGLLGIRPEHVTITARADVDGGVAGTVDHVTHAGADALVGVAVPGTAQPVVVRVPWAQRPEVRTAVNLTWDAAHTHHFDAATGRRQANDGRR